MRSTIFVFPSESQDEVSPIHVFHGISVDRRKFVRRMNNSVFSPLLGAPVSYVRCCDFVFVSCVSVQPYPSDLPVHPDDHAQPKPPENPSQLAKSPSCPCPTNAVTVLLIYSPTPLVSPPAFFPVPQSSLLSPPSRLVLQWLPLPRRHLPRLPASCESETSSPLEPEPYPDPDPRSIPDPSLPNGGLRRWRPPPRRRVSSSGRLRGRIPRR